jgi:hypothetical protein
MTPMIGMIGRPQISATSTAREFGSRPWRAGVVDMKKADERLNAFFWQAW